MTDQVNHFARLNAISVSDHIEKKGGFNYLSWPFAVAQLRLADPTATWEVRRFDGLPYLATDLGVFVEVAVTVQGITLSQIHPVLDGRNRPLQAPTAFDINTSLQRALVKAIALHGLGLYIYAGEDLPMAPSDQSSANDEPHGASPPSVPRSNVRHIAPTISGPQQATRVEAAACPSFSLAPRSSSRSMTVPRRPAEPSSVARWTSMPAARKSSTAPNIAPLRAPQQSVTRLAAGTDRGCRP